MSQSNAIAYLERKGWHYEMNGDQAKVAICPLCKKDKFHFYINTTGNKDGLWACHYCGKSGNLKTLQSNPDPAIGEAHIPNVRSMKDWANAGQQPDPLPDYERCHAALMEDDDALDYLYTTRGFSPEVVQKMKLGVQEYGGKKWLVIPYFDRHAQYTFCKFRTLPPADKDFRSPRHREAGLYNEECIRREMDELVIVEGEADCLSCLSNGVENVVGVPGANVQKASWLGLLDAMKPKQIYILYDTDHVGTKAAQQLAQRIGVDRCLKITLPEFCRLDGQPGKDINEWFLAGHTAEDFQALKEAAVQFDVEGVVNAAAAMDDLEEEILDKGELKGTYQTPWPELGEIIGAIEPGDVVALMAEAKVGKMQPLSAKVLTPNGWTTMGELKLGQRIASVDGDESVVTGIFPHGVKPQFRVTFSDGRFTRCGAEHLWKIGNVSNFTRDGYRVVDTETLATLKPNEWFIPLFNGEYGQFPVPLSPWLMGALLGDGGFTDEKYVHFTKTDPLVIERLSWEVEEYGDGLFAKDDIKEYDIRGGHIQAILDKLGLLGKYSIDKFIPDVYLSADRTTRLELLRGLMDTDGSVEGKYGVPCFNTSSPQLALSVVELVRSLGGIARIHVRPEPKYTHNGETRVGQPAYRVLLKLNNDLACASSHKAEKECRRTREARLKVISVIPDGEEEAQCISVSHPSSLYVTDDFIVTHNTTMADQWAEWFADHYGPSMHLNKEMLPKRLVRKLVSRVTQTDDTPGNITIETIKHAKALLADRKHDLLYCYSKGADFKKDADTIRQTVRRYGVKMVVIDNLQCYARSVAHQANEIFVLSKMVKELAMELAPMGVWILLIVQPNRPREGEIVAARNAAGSSGIEKDVDCLIVAHRNRIGKIKADDFTGFMETNENFEPQLLLRADLTRYASGGVRTLLFDGAKSTITSLPVADRVVKQPSNDFTLKDDQPYVQPEV